MYRLGSGVYVRYSSRPSKDRDGKSLFFGFEDVHEQRQSGRDGSGSSEIQGRGRVSQWRSRRRGSRRSNAPETRDGSEDVCCDGRLDEADPQRDDPEPAETDDEGPSRAPDVSNPAGGEEEGGERKGVCSRVQERLGAEIMISIGKEEEEDARA